MNRKAISPPAIFCHVSRHNLVFLILLIFLAWIPMAHADQFDDMGTGAAIDLDGPDTSGPAVEGDGNFDLGYDNDSFTGEYIFGENEEGTDVEGASQYFMEDYRDN